MEIGQTPSAPPPGSIAASLPEDTSAISSDFETFLRMLTVQMQNQDPLNPVDSTDYATQLATFSGVEQAVLTNDLLKTLTSQMNAGGLADMAAWVGKEARAAAPAYFDGSPVTIAPSPASAADQAEVIVRNEFGFEVQRFAVPVSGGPMEWAGVTAGGSPVATGLYSFELVSRANGKILSRTPVEVYSTVTEVRVEAGETQLVLRGGSTVTSQDVTALRDTSL